MGSKGMPDGVGTDLLSQGQLADVFVQNTPYTTVRQHAATAIDKNKIVLLSMVFLHQLLPIGIIGSYGLTTGVAQRH